MLIEFRLSLLHCCVSIHRILDIKSSHTVLIPASEKWQVRARMFTAEVAALQFNVLVTTYEYIMRDRSRLSKVRCWLPHAAHAC